MGDVKGLWCSHPQEWQPLLDEWQVQYAGHEPLTFHSWPQMGGEVVRGLTLGTADRPVRLLIAVPHAHEPAPTAAIVDLASQIITGQHRDGTPASLDGARILDRCLLTLVPDSNNQGRARSPERVWDGAVDNDTFLKTAFGIAADGERFGRYAEWRPSEHRPRQVGIVYEQIEPDLYVEPNTSRRSTHSRMLDELFARYRYTHYLDMHQHEGYEATLLPADFDDLAPESQARLEAWSDAVLGAWEGAGIPHKGRYVPYRGQPRQQLFRAFWAGRCPGMLKLTTETRNNRHIETDEPTSLEHQFRSAATGIEATLAHLMEARL